MPPKKKPSPPVSHRERLTLSKLASYDDVATDALVDRVRSLFHTQGQSSAILTSLQ